MEPRREIYFIFTRQLPIFHPHFRTTTLETSVELVTLRNSTSSDKGSVFSVPLEIRWYAPSSEDLHDRRTTRAVEGRGGLVCPCR